MKKLLLTTVAVFTILFAHAQIPCQANFSYMQNGPTTVFTDLSTMQSTNYSVTWQWDFGDGNTSTQQNPIHTYSNGIYAPCLTVTFLDSTLFNYCTAIYCDSILIGNGLPVSWDCNPVSGCYDPGNGNGQYTSFSVCDTMCGTNPSQTDWCDSAWFVPVFTEPVVGGMIGPFDLTLTGYISDSLNDVSDTVTHTFTTFQTSMSFTNYANVGSFPHSYTVNQILVTDTVTICWASELYFNGFNTFPDTCGFVCEDWIFDFNTGFWAKNGSVTSLDEINSENKKLIKIVDILGRETFPKNNEILFYIFDDGTINKRYIKE